MDRSFLSQTEVINASRSFVCIRLSTYESESEAKILKSIFIGGSGDLENTTFAILSPDADRLLVRPGRSPDFAFRGTATTSASRQMAETMTAIAKFYKVDTQTPNTEHALPALHDLRLALNVASCDSQPLVVAVARDAASRDRISESLRKLSWSDEFIGKCAYAVVSDPAELKLRGISGNSRAEGIFVVEPDRFGQKGAVLGEVGLTATAANLSEAMRAVLKQHQTYEKDTGQHIAEGRRLGVDWKTAIPVTDPGPQGIRRPPGFQ